MRLKLPESARKLNVLISSSMSAGPHTELRNVLRYLTGNELFVFSFIEDTGAADHGTDDEMNELVKDADVVMMLLQSIPEEVKQVATLNYKDEGELKNFPIKEGVAKEIAYTLHHKKPLLLFVEPALANNPDDQQFLKKLTQNSYKYEQYYDFKSLLEKIEISLAHFIVRKVRAAARGASQTPAFGPTLLSIQGGVLGLLEAPEASS